MCRDWNLPMLLSGNANGATALKNSLPAPQKVKKRYHMTQQFLS